MRGIPAHCAVQAASRPPAQPPFSALHPPSAPCCTTEAALPRSPAPIPSPPSLTSIHSAHSKRQARACGTLLPTKTARQQTPGWAGYPWISPVSPPFRRERGQRDGTWERPGVSLRALTMEEAAPGPRGPLAPGKGKKGVAPGTSQRNTALLAARFQPHETPCALQERNRMDLCCFTPLCLQ